MLLVFVDKISERLIYTFDFIFKARAIPYRFTNDWLYFNQNKCAKFVYSEIHSENELNIWPSTVLFDEAIFKYALSKENFSKEECLTFDKITDPFASIFYILSNYEEYIVKQRDEHERFESKNSLLVKYNWLEKVICDRISEDIIAFLESELQVNFNKEKIPTKLIPTFDIDNTFAFKWKEGLKKQLSFWRDKLKKDKLRLEARKKFVSGELGDPYDSYDTIKDCCNAGFDVKIFWLLGENGKYDKNISANDLRHQELIREMAHFAEIGLHPSYNSNSSVFFLKKEKETINQILKKKVSISRQHFLKVSIPYTYKTLISEGFTDDYSMGFAEALGFRSGTARSFPFFDLNRNETTTFQIHPFTYMDGTLNTYLKLSPEFAKQKIRVLFEEVKQFGGDFIFIWHNETITNFGVWKNWKSVFDFTLTLKNEI